MIDLLLGDLTGYMVAAVGVVAAVLGVYFKGRGDQKAKINRELDKAYRETRKRIDDAETFTDATDAREFLRNRLQSSNE